MHGSAAGSWIRALLVCAAVPVLVTGCAPVLGGGSGLRDDSRAGVGWKTVARKVEPNYLVAVDQTSCTVSSARFAEVREGQRVLCHWRTNSPVSSGRTSEPDAAIRDDSPPHSLATAATSGDYVPLSLHSFSRKRHGHPRRDHTAPFHPEIH